MVITTLPLAGMTQNTAFLKSNPYFFELDTDKLGILSRLVTERKVEKTEVIYLAGEPANVLYFVISGVIKLFITSFEGKEQILNLVRPRQSFEDVAVFDNGVHSTSAQAITKSVLYGIERNDLENLISDSPQFARNVIKVIASQTKRYISIVEDLSFKNVDRRLARILLEYGGDTANSCLPQLTQGDIAAMAGTVREVIGKALKAFASKGLVSLDRRCIAINDVETLRDVAVAMVRKPYDILLRDQKTEISNSNNKIASKVLTGRIRSMEYKNDSAWLNGQS
ncbi:Crp/Fnr family transcriptional regulator [Chloroflexota bacterium]